MDEIGGGAVQEKNILILSVDGGGVRGVFPATILRLIEERLDMKLSNYVSIFAGTSTGSILAAGMARGIAAAKLQELYVEHAPSIFMRRFIGQVDRLSLVASRYGQRELARLLDAQFHRETLGSLKTPLIVPAVDIGAGAVHVFKSGYHPSFVRDRDVLIRDALLASCAAPTYFDPRRVGQYRLADGGLWANNPSLVALLDAYRFFDGNSENVRILSLGTGTSRARYLESYGGWRDWLNKCLGWGFVGRWEHKRLLDLILNLQSESTHNQVTMLLGERPDAGAKVLRLNFESESPLPLDAPRVIPDLISQADRLFSHKAEQIRTFIEWGKV